MLRLKDETNIKELKKFGFKTLFGTPYNAYAYKIENKKIYICVDRINRTLYSEIENGEEITEKEIENCKNILNKLMEEGIIERI